MSCCGTCDHETEEDILSMRWGPQGFKIREDKTFWVAAPDRFAGWKASYGPGCESVGSCGGKCGGECSDECVGGCGRERALTSAVAASAFDVPHPMSANGTPGVNDSDWMHASILVDQDHHITAIWDSSHATDTLPLHPIPGVAMTRVLSQSKQWWPPEMTTAETACAAVGELKTCCVAVACRPLDGIKSVLGEEHCIFIKKDCLGIITSYGEGQDGQPGTRVGDTKIFKNAVPGLGHELFSGPGSSQEIDRGANGGGKTKYTTRFIRCSVCIEIVCAMTDPCDTAVGDWTVLEYPFGKTPWNANPFDCVPDNVCNTFAVWMGRQAGIDVPPGDAPTGGNDVENYEDYDWPDALMQGIGNMFGSLFG